MFHRGHPSFKGTLQQLNALKDTLLCSDDKSLPGLYDYLLKAISCHRVGNRPGRCEPRAIKRRRKSYPLLTKSREEARNELCGGSLLNVVPLV